MFEIRLHYVPIYISKPWLSAEWDFRGKNSAHRKKKRPKKLIPRLYGRNSNETCSNHISQVSIQNTVYSAITMNVSHLNIAVAGCMHLVHHSSRHEATVTITATKVCGYRVVDQQWDPL